MVVFNKHYLFLLKIMALTLIIKGTRKCNLRCSYCHDWRERGNSLSFEYLEQLIKKAQEKDNFVNYVWHGGEPTLLGIEWFQKVVELQNKYKSKGSSIRNTLQTNATLITDEWCNFFTVNKFSIGVSIDGPAILHDKVRYGIKKQDTYDDVLKGIQLLQNNKVSFGLLLVVTDDIINYGSLNIYNWVKELNTNRIAFLSQRPDTFELENFRESSVKSEYLPKSKYAKFLKEILQYWWADDGKGPIIRELESLIEGFIKGKPSLCVFAGSCVGKYFGIDPDGSIYHCDRYIPEKEFQVGHLSDTYFSFDNLKVEKIKTKVLEQEDEIKQNCKWYEVCHGGCPNDRHSDPTQTLKRNKCCGMNELIDDIYEKLKSTTK